MAYFDNAATTYPKPECVYSFMNEFYRNAGGSAGRGDYQLVQSASALIEDTRKQIMNILHCPTKQVVYAPTATIALNIIIQGVIRNGAKNIYISPFEHNAVSRILHYYEKNNEIKVFELHVSQNLEYDLKRIRYQFDSCPPDFIIISHASNVIGLIAPIEEIFSLGKKYGAITLADMAQTAGLIDTNVGLEIFDFAVFAGHKTLLGPTGISGFVMKPDISLEPVFFGGTGFDSANKDMPCSLPERYEFGTINILGVSGLNASTKWILEQGLDVLANIEEAKRLRLINLLTSYNYISIIGNVKEQKYVGIVSCLFDGISSDIAGQLLNKKNISVRTGLHCAPAAHMFLKTYPAGTIRFSVNCFTTDDDFVALQSALDFFDDNL